jgi:hypothetical protein
MRDQGLRYFPQVRRFAFMYMGEDPQAQNYDKDHRIIRSLLNGSRGPMLRKVWGRRPAAPLNDLRQ